LSADDYHWLMKARETIKKQYAMIKDMMEECFSEQDRDFKNQR
jgi:hypothetical protein